MEPNRLDLRARPAASTLARAVASAVIVLLGYTSCKPGRFAPPEVPGLDPQEPSSDPPGPHDEKLFDGDGGLLP